MAGASFQLLAGNTLLIRTSFTNADRTNNSAASFSFRNHCPLTFGGSQIRVTFFAGSGGTLITNNCSVGIGTGSLANTVATPVELKFSGVSGFSISANASIVSDWANLTSLAADKAVVIIDTGGTANIIGGASGVAGADRYYYSGGATYSTATPGGATGNDSNTYGVGLVEVR